MINGFKMGDISCMATLVGNTMLNHEDTMGNLGVRCRCLAFLGHLRMGQNFVLHPSRSFKNDILLFSAEKESTNGSGSQEYLWQIGPF